MKLWHWELGRQAGGYDKLLLAESKRLKFDVYLLRFPEGSKVKMHRDPSPDGFEHHRVNITLRSASSGGLTLVQRPEAPDSFRLEERRVYHFRPDLLRHFVTRILSGSILMLSIGWLRKTK